MIELHFRRPPFSRTNKSFSHCPAASASSAFEELDPATQYRQMPFGGGGGAFLEERRGWHHLVSRVDPLRTSTPLATCGPLTVRYNYITGVSEELHAEIFGVR